MTFNATYQGRVYALQGGTLYAFQNGGFAGTSGSATVDDQTYSNAVRVALTGYSTTSKKGAVGYQTTGGNWIILSEGWQHVGTAPIAKYSDTQAQALIDKIIKNNKIIISNNLLCARYANKLSETQRQQVRSLQSRLQARNNALQAEGLTTDVQTSYPAGYAELSAYLDALMAGESIGIAASTIAWIVVWCVVAAGLGTACYYAYKSLADESERDVKFSKELTRTLTSKLTAEEYQQLLDETKEIVTKSRIKTLLKGEGTMLLIGIGVAFVLYYANQIQNYRQ